VKLKKDVIKLQDLSYLEKVIGNWVLHENEYKNRHLILMVTKALSLLKYKESDIRKVILGIYLMDIGLHLMTDDEEYDNHPIKGVIYVGTSNELEIVKNVVLLHHENYIGTGFPYGLEGNQIPEYVQVVNICIKYIENSQERFLTKIENISKLNELYNNDLVEYLNQKIF
jgi:hypothetical protein